MLFVDLDDTLFCSDRKHPPTPQCVPLAFLKDGQPISYASAAQQSMLQLLQQTMEVVPVTARNLNAFSRVRIDFSSAAILNYGGTVLDADGQIDAAWLERSQRASASTLDALAALERDLLAHCASAGLALSVRTISDHGVAFYIVIKSPSGQLQDIDAIATHCARLCQQSEQSPSLAGFRLHRNGNNVALLPPWLDKSHAVAYVKQKLAQRHPDMDMVTFGMGDSLVDLAFMNQCQYMIVPSASQIAQTRMGAL